jgi:flagellar biosynthesis protein FlhF
MKIRRYLAKDMRLALKQVREQQGPDAVILNTRTIGDQVEVVAAIDFDAESFENGAQETAPAKSSSADYDFAGVMNRRQEQAAQQAQQKAAASQQDMSGELNALRRMLETQLATLAWNDLTRRAPVHTEVLKTVSALGVTTDIAAQLVSQLPARLELAEAQRLALAMLAQRIPTSPERWIEKGGVLALIGPTGVGKTSTIAKLAARWVLHRGSCDLALVSADNSRIGAHEHLQSIGRLLGVPSYSVEHISQLPALLADLGRRRFVLIDTAGIGQRDARLGEELKMLAQVGNQLETALVLAASSQAGAIEQIIRRFAPIKPAACVLTKIDEAASLGGALSAVVRAQLPIAYVSEGQRVAEDLHPARGHRLIARAVQLTKQSGASADEDLLSRRFGGIAHGIA